MGEECAAEGNCQRKFTHIVMVHVQVTIDSRANFCARKIYLVWDCVSGRTNHVQQNSLA